MATVCDSTDMKQAVAKEWSKLYKREFKDTDMTCYGCKSDKRFLLCQKCDIERCNKVKENDNCKVCAEYACERILQFESNLQSKDLYYR